jgi:LysR family transcriptional regulator, regulator for bpeEF and oprC
VTGARKALISRRVQELEERLETTLLARTTRSVRLTEEGRGYFEHAQRALAAAREAEAALAAGKGRPTGTLRVTTTAVLAEMLLEPVALRYLERYANMALELDVSSRTVDLVREGFDLAIRAGALPDSSLTARRLGEARIGYFASPSYVKRRGAPGEPRELSNHATVVIGGGAVEWPFGRSATEMSVVPRARLITTSYELALRAAIAGLGITRIPGFYAREHVRQGRLCPVLEAWTPPAFPVHAVMPGGIAPPKTRTFVEMVVKFLDREPVFAEADPGV